MVESFEISACSDAVMSTSGRLLRRFPGRAVSCPSATFFNEEFLNQLSVFLCKLQAEPVEHSSTASFNRRHNGEPASPRFVADCLMTMLGVVGAHEDVATTEKRVRDDILSNSSQIPWSRAPFWLFLRVAILRALTSSLDPSDARKEYKRFMIHVVARSLDLLIGLQGPPDHLSVLHAKLARRVFKYDREFGEAPVQQVVDISLKAQEILSSTWSKHITTLETLPGLPTANWESATNLRLAHSRKSLLDASTPLSAPNRTKPFAPPSQSRIAPGTTSLPSLSGVDLGGSQLIILADVEQWVNENLTAWTQSPLRSQSPQACDDLANLIKDYWDLALSQYSSSPLARSAALLTIIELWVALDKIATAKLGLLKKYSPGIPWTISQPLLLPKLGQMERLAAVEECIRARHDSADPKAAGIFATPDETSFSIWYYGSSDTLQNIHGIIQDSDRQKRREKIKELGRLTITFNDLLTKADQEIHLFVDDNEGEKYYNASACRKCQLQAEAKGMTIKIHEDSLPEDEVQRQAAVFELAVPREFAAWRDLTWLIVHDIGHHELPRLSQASMHMLVKGYKPVQRFCEIAHRQSRITMGSSTRPFTNGYANQHFPTTEEKTCVKNNLRYDIWDEKSQCWLKTYDKPPKLKGHCTLKIPSGPYTNLTWAFDTSEHTANEVMSRQSECDKNLEIQEFISYCTLRAGERLQWINILRELGCNNLSQNNSCVTLLMLQAIWEVGSPSQDPLREAHAELRKATFCRRLLFMLQARLHAIQSNWQEQHSMMTIIQLCLRVVSLTQDDAVETESLELLQQARTISLDWCRQLQKHMHENSAQPDVQVKAVDLLLSAALLCFSTFDVDAAYLPHILTSQFPIAAEAQIIICDNSPADAKRLPLLAQQCLLQYLNIAHKIEPHAQKILRNDSTELSQAVQKLWDGVVLIHQWKRVTQKASSWVHTKTIPRTGGRVQTVHYNLIGGDLLVDGKPLGKVPQRVKSQPLFQQIFGPAILQVFISDMPGMDYRVSQLIENNEVHIGSFEGKVLIKTRTGERVMQALAPDVFSEDLPLHFINDFTHWLDEVTHEVEFRHRRSPWKFGKTDWRLTFSDSNLLTANAQMRNRATRLVDNRSRPGRALDQIFGLLESPSYCHISMDDTRRDELEIYLPRYNLHFVATTQGQIRSLELNALVDSNQGLGTLVGLRDKLVLLDPSPLDDVRERRVLVPYGLPEIQKSNGHVNIKIKREENVTQRYFVYKLDRHLRRVRGEFDLMSQLLKAYLHAITSFTLPDPFTGRTGTEEAIDTLKEASLYSVSPLSLEEKVMLNAIAALTPKRDYYPSNKKSAQKVFWNPNLSPLVQHDDFYLVAEAIFNNHGKVEVLHEESARQKKGFRDGGDLVLAGRARKRNASVTKSGLYTRLVISGDDDYVYDARDQAGKRDSAVHVFRTAHQIIEWPSHVAVVEDLAAVLKRWRFIYGYHAEFNAVSLQELAYLKLDKHWGSLYELCRTSTKDSSTYSLLFTFCPIAFGTEGHGMKHVRTLLAFAFSDAFRTIDPPQSVRQYDLNLGAGWSENQILDIIRNHTVRPRKRARATTAQAADHRRRLRDYETECSRLIARVKAQWPQGPIAVVQGEYSQIGPFLDAILRECRQRVRRWQQNRRFLEHIRLVNDGLQNMQSPDTARQLSITELSNPSQHRDVCRLPSLSRLLRDDVRAEKVKIISRPASLFLRPWGMGTDTTNLEELFDNLPESTDANYIEHVDSLRASREALDQKPVDLDLHHLPLEAARIGTHHKKFSEHVQVLLSSIREALAPSSAAELLLAAADLWPRSSELCLLQSLSRSRISALSTSWNSKLLSFADRIASWQRSERMVVFHRKGNLRNLCKELVHQGRDNWQASEHPYWLLLEIENNITIRPVQAEVALEMMSPRSGANAVLQLNMGEGKSSVIVPMIAAALANGSRLIRVIVLKPLLRQTELVLTQRLGSLLDQRVCHIPFSRKTPITPLTINCIQRIHESFKEKEGIMITLPEETLSMQLMTRERMTMQPELSASILDLQRWIRSNCRDILDESDEILGIRSQLIYPVGSQQMLDGKTDRWLVVQAVLRRLLHHAALHPEQLELDYNGKSFPSITIPRPEIFTQITALLVDDALDGQIAGVGFDFYSEGTRSAIREFISTRQLSEVHQTTVMKDCSESSHWPAILILRGLFAHGVLQFVFQQKRWLVEYGLHPSRCLMAVPYRAKGVPSTNSEFGHPDVGILLTCLSYYYTGLSTGQIENCFKLLSKDPDAQDIYATWASTCEELPAEFRTFDSVNLDDQSLCQKVLFPKMQYNLETISFFLNQVVFPKEGKGFAQRISASGWDIPAATQDPRLLTTGFSGTNDSRSILPFSIKQQDLDDLRHTNAHVLNLVLRDENKNYIHGVAPDGKRLDVTGMLELFSQQDPRVNVLIDVGAQVLEASNFELAKQWLDLETDANAAIFFDDQDEATVLDRSGCTIPLRISPFSNKLDGCLVYLDEVHTRGIDLAIPMSAHAAVTLGPRLSKDRLMQGK